MAIKFQETFKRGNVVSHETLQQRFDLRSNLLSMGGHGKAVRIKNAA